MITLLHGENIVGSRNYLNDIRVKHTGEIIVLDGKTVLLGEIKQAVESLSLFSGSRLVIIENLCSRLSKTQLKEYLSYLFKAESLSDIVIWEGKEITKVSLKNIPKNWKVESYPIPKVIFNFLDNISPGNNIKMLSLLKDSRKTNDDNFLFLMIVRQIRMLLLAFEGGLVGMPPWMAGKFSRQAKKYSKEDLLKLYKKLLLIDIGQKSGTAAFDLTKELDLLMATL